MLSRFHLIPERYGRTDRFAILTDGAERYTPARLTSAWVTTLLNKDSSELEQLLCDSTNQSVKLLCKTKTMSILYRKVNSTYKLLIRLVNSGQIQNTRTRVRLWEQRGSSKLFHVMQEFNSRFWLKDIGGIRLQPVAKNSIDDGSTGWFPSKHIQTCTW